VPPRRRGFPERRPYSTILDHAVALRDCGFTEAELAGIDRGNALELLPQYAA
jgi:hypothetical protein